MNFRLSNITIISGGQTGVDRAALDIALENNIPCSGWCPKGRRAEDGQIHLKYPLLETITAKYPERTAKNILNSDATIILYAGKFDPGTALTLSLCKKKQKPFRIINLLDSHNFIEIIQWLQINNVRILNIAGPRESFSPGIYLKAIIFLKQLISAGN